MKLQTFNQQEVLGNNFEIYGDIENPLFLAKDVAKWIEHSNVSAMLLSIDEEEKDIRIVYTPGGNQEMWFLTEDGLYEVLMQSRKPIAKQFKKEVKKILKEIRKYGKYQVPTNMKEALQLALQQQEQIDSQQAMIEQLQPKADYVDTILQSNDLVNINQIANDYGLSAQALNKILEEDKVQYKCGGQWLMYSKHRQKGYVRSETREIKKKDGSPKVVMHTKWTQKGRLFINELLNNRGIEAIVMPSV